MGLGIVVKIANEVSKSTSPCVNPHSYVCGLACVSLQLTEPPVQYERRNVEAGFCGGFVAQWFMVALVRHPGFESRSCWFFAFLLSLSAG